MSVSVLASLVKATGSNIIYQPDFTGIGGTIVLRSGDNIIISGSENNGGGGVTGISTGVTTLNGLTGNISLIGEGTVSIIVLNNNIIISGLASGNSTNTNISAYFNSNLSTGADSYYILYPTVFALPPIVNVSLESSYYPITYGYAVSGRNVSGFWINFTDIIIESGLSLNIMARPSGVY